MSVSNNRVAVSLNSELDWHHIITRLITIKYKLWLGVTKSEFTKCIAKNVRQNTVVHVGLTAQILSSKLMTKPPGNSFV